MLADARRRERLTRAERLASLTGRTPSDSCEPAPPCESRFPRRCPPLGPAPLAALERALSGDDLESRRGHRVARRGRPTDGAPRCRGGPSRPGLGADRHLLAQGVPAGHQPLSRPLHLLHLPQGPRRSRRVDDAARGDPRLVRARPAAWLHRGAHVPRRQTRGGVPRLPRDARRASGIAPPSSTSTRACEIALDAGLLPHTNAGVLTRDEMARLRPVNVSLGLMLENVSPAAARARRCRTTGRPTRSPAVRLQMLREAGELRIPFTTGILIGIGETRRSASTPCSPSATCTARTATSRK